MLVLVFVLAAIIPTGKQIVPEHAPFVHGELANIEYLIDGDGFTWPADRYAFLAVQVAPVGGIVEYQQDVDHLIEDGYVIRSSATISRHVRASEADEDGWLLLRLSKPCEPDQVLAEVGTITVCPPRDVNEDRRIDGCAIAANGIVPIYQGRPSESVKCGASKRRAVRR